MGIKPVLALWERRPRRDHWPPHPRGATGLIAARAPLPQVIEIVTLLQSWLDEKNPEEQQETGEYLIHTLDEDRLSDRQLFPAELKDISW